MSTLYEQIADLAMKLQAEAEEMVPTDGDPDFEYDLTDPTQMEAWVLTCIAPRIIEAINTSDEADTSSSASTQHFIDTGIRLPRDTTGIIAAAARNYLHGVDDFTDDQLKTLADALDVPHDDVEALHRPPSTTPADTGAGVASPGPGAHG